MRRAILAILLLLLCADAVVAADMRRGRKPPPLPPPAYMPPPAFLPPPRDWTGWYLGINGGGGWGNARSDFSVAGSPPFAAARNPMAGILGGAQLGYNYQSGRALFGVEADFQFANLRGSLMAPDCPALVC